MKTFSPQCTLPPPGTNYVSAPSARSTFDIVWGSLSVILLCTWSILHLNVPFQAHPTTTYQSVARRLSRTARKLRWMLFSAFAPEYTLGAALWDLLASYHNRNAMGKWASIDGVEWTLTHAFFANMGGIAIVFDHLDNREAAPEGDASESCRTPRGEFNQAANAASGRSSFEPTAQIGETPSYPLADFNPSHGLLEEGQDNATTTPVAEPSHGRASAHSVEIIARGHKVSDRDCQLQERLKHLSRSNGYHSFASFEKRVLRTQRALGRSSWKVSAQNRDLVSQAIDNITEDRFGPGVFSPISWLSAVVCLQGNTWTLDANQLLLARELGIISRLPDIEVDQLENESKSDALVKALAIVQISWLIIQVVARAVKKRPVSQLEILAIALAVCSLITYGLLFKKPQDVTVTKQIRAQRYPTQEEITELGLRGPWQWVQFRSTYALPTNYFAQPVRNSKTLKFPYRLGAMALGAIIFGALHLLAWDFDFPTSWERTLWRASSLATIGAPVLGFATVALGNTWRWTTGLFYILARLCITVEAFRVLAFLPPEAFSATWTIIVPHVG